MAWYSCFRNELFTILNSSLGFTSLYTLYTKVIKFAYNGRSHLSVNKFHPETTEWISNKYGIRNKQEKMLSTFNFCSEGPM
jgi:hypothetical protein